jgi:4-amino-4-deoxy-L-arabinose transferase-like glycosyltransferase
MALPKQTLAVQRQSFSAGYHGLLPAKVTLARLSEMLGRKWDAPLAGILALSFVLNSFGFWYALPYPPPATWQPPGVSVQNWAFDSIAPVDPLAAGVDLFSWGRWSRKVFDYPLAHYMVLGAVYAPYLLVLFLTGGFVEDPSPGYPYGLADPVTTLTVLTVLARFVAAAMGTGSVFFVYGLTVEFFGRRAGLFAAISVALGYVFIFYAHTENLEIPYLFWALLALWAYARVIRVGGHRNFILLGVGSALAIATKDQAYALFTLMPAAVLWAHYRLHQPSAPTLSQVVPWLVHRHLVSAGLGFVAAFTLGNNLLFNFPRFVLHLQFLLRNPTLDRYLDPTAPGDYLRLFQLTLYYLQAAMGWPIFVLAGLGLLHVLWRHRASSWPLMLPLLSYYGLFIFGNLFYVHARHMLPVAILLAPFVGKLVNDLLENPALPRWALCGMLAATYTYSAVYGFSVNLTLICDSRQQSADWLSVHAPVGSQIEVYSPRLFLPRYLEDYRVEAARFDLAHQEYSDGLRRRQPDFVIVTEQQYRPGADLPESMAYASAAQTNPILLALLSGKLGYRLEASFKYKLHDWLFADVIYGQNPRVLIFKRAED